MGLISKEIEFNIDYKNLQITNYRIPVYQALKESKYLQKNQFEI